MSESLGRAVLELVADLNPLKAQLAEGKAASEEMAASSARGFKSGISKAALPAAAALGVLTLGMKKSIDAAEEDQKSQARLEAVLKANGLEYGRYAGAIDAAEKSGVQLGFQVADTRDALGTLTTATGSVEKATALLSTAQDIARYKHISLADASKTLAMTMAGSTRAAKQLGIQTQTVTTAQDKVKAAFKQHSGAEYAAALATAKLTDKQAQSAKVIQLVNDKLHGQAKAYASTAAGAKDRMGAEVNRLEVSLGNALLPALTAVTGGLADATGWLQKHATVAKIAIGIIAGVAAAVLLLNAAFKIQAFWTKIAEADWLSLDAVMSANPIMLTVLALAALGVAFAIAWKKSATFREIVLGAWNAVKRGVMAVLGFFTKTIPHAFMSVLNWVKGHWPMIAVFLSGPFAPLVALATNAFGVRDKLIGAFKAIWGFAKGLWNGLGRVWGAAWSGAWGLVKGVINLMIGGINWLIGAWDSLHFHFGGIAGIGAFDVGVPHIDKIPLLAEGGIVTKATLAVIGEKGPEAVIPLGRHGMGSGTKIEINVSGVVGNPREVAVTIGRELQKLKKRGVDFELA